MIKEWYHFRLPVEAQSFTTNIFKGGHYYYRREIMTVTDMNIFKEHWRTWFTTTRHMIEEEHMNEYYYNIFLKCII